jgi:hypothetical protein
MFSSRKGVSGQNAIYGQFCAEILSQKMQNSGGMNQKANSQTCI